MTTFAGKLEPSAETAAFIAEWQAEADAAWPATLARILEQSLLSGTEVVYKLDLFDEDWSPIYLYPAEDPIAWINRQTAERRDGPRHPLTT